MFEPKQSDYWFIEDTDDFLLCTVSSMSAQGTPCRGDLVSIHPIIQKINRDTNKKQTLFPSGSGQLSAFNKPGYLLTTVPDVSANINVTEISKPQITFNNTNNLYNISFTGKYSDNNLAIFSYIFQYTNESMHLVDSHAFIPESKNYDFKYTFEDGYIHPDYIIKGNKTSNVDTFFRATSAEVLANYFPPDYQFKPFHYGNDLKFGATIFASAVSALSGNSIAPITYAGGFIAMRTEVDGFTTENCITVDFTCKSYSLNNQSYLEAQAQSQNALSGERAVSLYGNTSDEGEGFCVFFYEPRTEEFPIYIDTQESRGVGWENLVGIGSTSVIEDPNLSELELNGIGKTLGYVPASANRVEFNGIGVYNMGGIKANGFLAVSFDIAGDFCTEDDGMPGSYDGTTYTQSASTIGIRGGEDNDYKVLGRSSAITSIPIHERVATEGAASYKYFRVELLRKATTVKVMGRASEGDPFTLLYTLDLKNFYTTIPSHLKAGLVFNTGRQVSNFELNKFKIDGVKSRKSRYPGVITQSDLSPVNSQYNTTCCASSTRSCVYQGDLNYTCCRGGTVCVTTSIPTTTNQDNSQYDTACCSNVTCNVTQIDTTSCDNCTC